MRLLHRNVRRRCGVTEARMAEAGRTHREQDASGTVETRKVRHGRPPRDGCGAGVDTEADSDLTSRRAYRYSKRDHRTMPEHYEPPGIAFIDFASGREMKLVTAGPWEGWIVYRHPDGQWVALREATYDDRTKIERFSVGHQR